MKRPHALFCIAPARPAQLEVRLIEMPKPRAGEVLVAQRASSINPIDAKRAAGYGKRLLSLRGAGRFPLVLGNDVAGIVQEAGPGASDLKPGTLVFGLKPTGASGAHASHVAVPRQWLRTAPAGSDPVALGALPYSFTTVWLAMEGAGLSAKTARGRKVLVSGAAGGLGQLALQLLRHWGAVVTAVDLQRNLDRCAGLGAAALVARESAAMVLLPADFAAILNFASWEDDALLAGYLDRDALGYATTVHPLLGNFDRHGFLKALWTTRRQKAAGRATVKARSESARYAWTVFRPSGAALDALAEGVSEGWLQLPIGIAATLDDASAGFAHVEAGKPGRAVLTLGDR